MINPEEINKWKEFIRKNGWWGYLVIVFLVFAFFYGKPFIEEKAKQHASLPAKSLQSTQQPTPYLSVEFRPGRVYVGPDKTRIDEVVTISIRIQNNEEPTAYYVEADVVILVDSSQAEGVSINTYQRGVNAPIVSNVAIATGDHWDMPLLAPSVMGNAYEIYKSGKNECKIKILLSWKDLEGKEYKQITLAKLQYKPKIETVNESFWWEVKDTIDSRNEPEKLETHWGTKFNF